MMLMINYIEESCNNILYIQNSEGHFISIQANNSTPTKAQAHIKHPHDSSGTGTTKPQHSNLANQRDNGDDWDGWPDGPFVRDFTWEEWEATGHLQVHLATKMGGGYRGDENAAHWTLGKKTT